MSWLGDWISSFLVRGAVKYGREKLISLFAQETLNDLSRLLREAFCFNQGMMIQYLYMVAEKHKSLKEALNAGAREESVVRGFLIEMEDYIVSERKRIILQNLSYMRRALEREKGRLAPFRICVKEPYEDNGEQKIITMLREKDALYEFGQSIDANKASLHVKAFGEFYICNDIPAKSKESPLVDGYFNPRLNPSAVQMYSPSALNFLFEKGKKVHVDQDWINCWNRVELDGGRRVAPPKDSCYKSTLVIPLTLLNNKLERDFWGLLISRGKESGFFSREEFSVDEAERQIYGYLCIDSIATEFFNDTYDVNVGYFFADMVSIFVFISRMFTGLSRTYRLSTEYINNG